MNYPASADIDRHMSRIADQIPRLRIRVADCLSALLQRIGTARQRDSEMLVHQRDKTGAVRPFRQTVAAVDIWITQKVCGL